MNRRLETGLASRFSRGVWTALAITCLMFGATEAKASCGWTGAGSGKAVMMPMLSGAGQEGANVGSNPSIVGLWAVVYTAGGQVFNESWDEWHSDGTEFENAYLNPVQGDICFGVWKQIGPSTVKLHHIGWTFTPGNLGTATGTFSLDEVNTVSSNGNTYTGSFHFQAYDIKGNKQADVSGTMKAQRITID
ncbi:MAG TPA: hypothetical protein VMB49_22515 [Acidobacteriaceae bacterium]|nr:hypothetical protein [Acidobacteriaceae bacterium]